MRAKSGSFSTRASHSLITVWSSRSRMSATLSTSSAPAILREPRADSSGFVISSSLLTLVKFASKRSCCISLRGDLKRVANLSDNGVINHLPPEHRRDNHKKGVGHRTRDILRHRKWVRESDPLE